MLERVRSRRRKRREQAVNDLGSCLCHQSTIYAASPVAVPHLVELAVDPAVLAQVPRLLAAAPHAPPGWRALCLALCAFAPGLACEAEVDPVELVDDGGAPAHVAARRLLTALLRDEDAEAALLEAVAFDEDLAEYHAEVLAGQPLELRARQVVLELASRG
jgi:hypothetical protein